MSGIDWDFYDIDLSDKTERNIEIGKAQINNENLSAFLIETITNLLNYYKRKNNLQDDQIIITQRDGMIVTKELEITTGLMQLDFRGKIDLLVITPDRRKFLSVEGEDISVKGITNYYPKLDAVYQKFTRLNFVNKTALFSQLDAIRSTVLKMEDKEFFMIPIDTDLAIQTPSGPIITSGSNTFSLKDLDKMKYYNHYFREFIESIFLEYY